MIDGPWDVWGSLLNGIIGSGVGAAIAVVVLVVSLKKQSSALAAQLTAQQEALTIQLTAGQAENSKARINVVAGQLMEAISLLPLTRTSNDAISAADRLRSFNAVYQLQLDLTHDEIEKFVDPLITWLQHLAGKPLDELRKPGEVSQIPEALMQQSGWILRCIPKWIRASADERVIIGKDLKVSLEVALKGPGTWLDMYPRNPKK